MCGSFGIVYRDGKSKPSEECLRLLFEPTPPLATLELLEENLEVTNELRRLFRDLETNP